MTTEVDGRKQGCGTDHGVELRDIKTHGSEADPETPKNLQSRVFDIARNNRLDPKEFFKLLYRILINADRGPRIGNYAVDSGLERTCQILEKYLVNRNIHFYYN